MRGHPDCQDVLLTSKGWSNEQFLNFCYGRQMMNDILKVQADSLNFCHVMNKFFNTIGGMEQGSKWESIKDRMETLLAYGKMLPTIVGIFGYERAFDKAEQIRELCEQISSEEDVEVYAAALCEMVDEMAEITAWLAEKKESTCICCGNQVYYRPLPLYYETEAQNHGAEKHIGETINKNDYSCPVCIASDRDRLMTAFLQKFDLDSTYVGETMLHIAPSCGLERWIQVNCPSLTYHSADLFRKDVTYVLDIQDMYQIEDESYDYIICSYVLEHVQDDRKAMRELYRIMKEDGFCLFLVPVSLDLEHTDEEWGLEEAENWKRFGQGDHCRRYAKQDLVARLKEAGFCVHQLGKEFFGEDVFAECALTDTSTLYVLTRKKETIEDQIEKKKEKQNAITREELPLVSVIMSSYNHEEYVAEAIESVLNQTYPNIEFLVADDCSTDGTVQEILKYEDRIDQIHLFDDNAFGRKPFLCSIARGKYIAVMNSDDVWDKEKLRMQVAYMENHPECGACFTGVANIVEGQNDTQPPEFIMENKTRTEWMRYFYEKGNCLAHPAVLIERSLYQKLLMGGAYAFRQLGDFWMWVRLVQKYEIHVIEQELTGFRYHETGKNKNISVGTPENFLRHYTEEAYIWYHIIKNMDAQFFMETFADQLSDQSAQTENEILCEKFFVLLNSEKMHLKQSAVFFILDIYQNPDVAELLEKRYRFDRKKIYELTGRAWIQAEPLQ